MEKTLKKIIMANCKKCLNCVQMIGEKRVMWFCDVDDDIAEHKFKNEHHCPKFREDKIIEIKMYCKCGAIHQVPRDKTATDKATSMGCNWCPTCENDKSCYDEWYNYNAKENGQPEMVDPNQLKLF